MASKPAIPAFIPIHVYMDQLVESLRDTAPAALKQFEVEAIHDARVATRRLKAAMDLIAQTVDTPEHRRFGKVLKKLRRRLGPLRDIDVMVEHLAELAKQKRYAKAAEWVKARLIERQQESREAMGKKQAVGRMLGRLGSWWALRQQVKELEPRATASMLAQAITTRLAEFSTQSDRLGATPAEGGAPAERQDPHALRITGKLLRYTLELTPVAGVETPRPILKDFKRLQEALGLWHDYVVLSQQAVQLAAETQVAVHDLELYGQVLDLSRKALSLAAQQLKRFSRLWAESRERLTLAIGGLVAPPAPEPAPPAEPVPPAEAVAPELPPLP